MREKREHTVSQEQVTALIQKRAYELSRKRGFAPGHEWQDWFEAERQVRRELHMAV